MIAQVLLTLGLSGAWLYVVTQPGVTRIIRWGLYGIIASGIYFVWLPSHATDLAHLLGVGRGADLIFYIWIIFSFGVLINLHIKLRSSLNLVTRLARHIAIEKPHSPANNMNSTSQALANMHDRPPSER